MLGKVLGTVITEIEIHKVTVRPVVCHTSRQVLIALADTVLQILAQIDCFHIRILCILQCCSGMMVSKRTVPIKLYIKEFATVSFGGTLLSHIAAIRHFLPYNFSRILVSGYCKPLFRPFVAFDVVSTVIIITEAPYKTQSFGHEIQFLLQ